MVRPGCVACVFVGILLAAAVLLVFAFAFVEPIHVTVEDATLGRFGLASPADNSTGNGTAAASLAYNLSLVVSVSNTNWAMRLRRVAPLDAELRFASRALHRFPVAGAADWRRMHPQGKVVQRFTAAGESALGRDGAAELATESAAGEFHLQLVIAGQFKYQAHSGRYSIWLTCPLKLQISTAMVRAFFQSVECKCT